MKKVAHTAFIPTGNIRYALQITPYGVGRFLLYPILVFAMLNLQAQGKVAPKKLVTHKKVPVLIYSRKQGIQRYYHWLSSKEFCWIEPIGSSASEHRVISYRLDKKAKFQRAIVNRNILYHGFDGDTVDPWTFSPDGRYLLCFDRDKPFTFRRLYDLVSRPVVEHRFQDAFSASERNLLWMPSAKQWAEISLDGGSIFVQIRSLQGESIHEVYASGDLRKTTLLGITSEKTLLLLKNDY